MPGFAFPEAGPVGLGSPPYRPAPPIRRPSVLCSAKTALCPSRFTSLPLVPRYLASLPSFVASSRLAYGGTRSACARTFLSGRPIRSRQGDRWLSQVPELPLCTHAPLSDPGGARLARHYAHPTAAFRRTKNVGSSTIIEISGLYLAACALATPGSGLRLTARPRVHYRPAGYALIGWDFHPLGNNGSFLSSVRVGP